MGGGTGGYSENPELTFSQKEALGIERTEDLMFLRETFNIIGEDLAQCKDLPKAYNVLYELRSICDRIAVEVVFDFSQKDMERFESWVSKFNAVIENNPQIRFDLRLGDSEIRYGFCDYIEEQAGLTDGTIYDYLSESDVWI